MLLLKCHCKCLMCVLIVPSVGRCVRSWCVWMDSLTLIGLGNAVTARAEIHIRNCVVLPHKSLSASTSNEVVL